MSIATLAAVIGKPALLSIESLKVPVTVRDVRQAYGRTDYLVTPANGMGSQWVSDARVTLGKEGGQ